MSKCSTSISFIAILISSSYYYTGMNDSSQRHLVDMQCPRSSITTIIQREGHFISTRHCILDQNIAAAKIALMTLAKSILRFQCHIVCIFIYQIATRIYNSK